MQASSLISQLKNDQQQLKISIYLDYQNVRLSQNEARLLLDFAKYRGNLVGKYVYYNSHYQYQVAGKNALASIDYTCFDVPCNLKNSADNQLIADCLEHIDSHLSPDIVILVSGDGDFTKLVRHLQKLDKQVIILAQKGNVKQKLIESANDFYFLDQLPQLVEASSKSQLTAVDFQLNYNEAIEHLIAAINTALIQGKRTLFSNIDKLMRQICVNYKGYSSIATPTGKKFKSFGQFVDFAVNTGKIQTKNQELFLIDLEKITA